MDGDAASVRVETPSLARTLDTWTLAILGEMDSSLAMTRLPRGRRRAEPQDRNAQRQLEALGYDVIITLREDAA